VGFLEAFRRNLPTGRNVNVSVAAYVTTQPRLKLYQYLRELGESVLYCDTDSVIYIHKVGEVQEVKTGDYLGDFTDELENLGQAPTLKSLSRVTQKTTQSLSFAPRLESTRRNEK
jgi:hypothetical protein